VEGTCQLKLVPRAPFAERDQFTEIRLWYRPATLRPRMARTINRQGDVSIVRLVDVEVNEPLPEGVLSTKPPPEGAGWDIIVDEGRFAPDEREDREQGE